MRRLRVMTNIKKPPQFKERFWQSRNSAGNPTTNILSFLSHLGAIDYIKTGLKEFPDISAFGENASPREWSGNCSFGDAITRFQHGNTSYTQAFLEGLKAEEMFAEENTSFGMDVEGIAYDMGAVLDGNPECCLSQGYPELKRMLKVCVDITFSARIEPDVIRYRGIAIANLINTLAQLGYILDVDVLYIHDKYNLVGARNLYEFFRINTQTQCTAEFAFYMTPEFMRILCFAIAEIHNARKGGRRDIGGDAYGHIAGDFLKEMEEESVFFIGGSYNDVAMGAVNTQAEANALIVKRFNEFCERRRWEGLPK